RSSLPPVSVVPTASALANSELTRFRLLARVVARTAVVLVPVHVDASSLAPGKPGSAPWVKAHPIPVAIRLRIGANVPAGAAIVGSRAQERARPVAVDGPLDASVGARAVDARGVLVDAST